MTTVLLAVDETDESIAAVQTARELFGSSCDFLAVNVTEGANSWGAEQPRWGAVYPFPFDAAYPLIPEPQHDVGHEPGEDPTGAAEATAARVAAQGGVAAEAVAEVGDAPSAIIAAAERYDVDVIVVGAHERSWWRRLFDGSVSATVTKQARRPVLVVSSTEQH